MEESDLTEFNLFFADLPVQREVELSMMTPANLSESFFISRMKSKRSRTATVDEDISLLSVMPHCHLLGKAWEVYAVSPNQADTIPLISIPEWDFNWQGIYDFPSLKHIPAGYTVHAICTYDNTSDNFAPTIRRESWGDLTGDEMYVLFPICGIHGRRRNIFVYFDEDTRIVYKVMCCSRRGESGARRAGGDGGWLPQRARGDNARAVGCAWSRGDTWLSMSRSARSSPAFLCVGCAAIGCLLPADDC